MYVNKIVGIAMDGVVTSHLIWWLNRNEGPESVHTYRASSTTNRIEQENGAGPPGRIYPRKHAATISFGSDRTTQKYLGKNSRMRIPVDRRVLDGQAGRQTDLAVSGPASTSPREMVGAESWR
jgi:hypothetical protein